MDDMGSNGEHGPQGPRAEDHGGQGTGRRSPWRWVRGLGIFMVLLLVAGATLGPPLASKWLRGEIEKRAGERIDGKVTVQSVSLSVNGKARIESLEVEDRDGNLVAKIPDARLDVGLRSFLTGKRDVSTRITGAEIEVFRRKDGTFNVSDLVLPSSEGAGEEPDPEEEGDPRSLLELDIFGRLELVDAQITLRSEDSALQLRDVFFGIGFDGKERGMLFETRASLFGGEGSAGDFEVHGEVWPKAQPGGDLTLIQVKALDLGAVAAAMDLLGSPLGEGSVLEGTLDLDATASSSELVPEAAMVLQGTAKIGSLLMDLRDEGLATLAFNDREASASFGVQRSEAGAEPKANFELLARDGKLRASGAWDGAAAEGLAIDVVVDGLAASAGLEPLLARVHPAFATARAIDGAAVDALVTSRVDIRYSSPLPLEAVKGGWSALPKEPFQGTGSLSVDEGLVETSPLFAEALKAFGEPTNPTFKLKPLGFTVDSGRLSYTNPWTWTIQGTETRFAGSVGLDSSVDLRWIVPVTGGLAAQNRVFQALQGETFEVGLGGTLTSPTFNLAGALTSLAKRAGERRLRDELEDQKSKLGDKLKEQLEKELGGDASKIVEDVLGGKLPIKSPGDAVKTVEETAKKLVGSGDEAETMLKRADGLWNIGMKREAAVLYKRIRKEFPLSPTYLLNKKRVKARQDG